MEHSASWGLLLLTALGSIWLPATGFVHEQQTGQYLQIPHLQTPKHLAPKHLKPSGSGWRAPCSVLLKALGGRGKPASPGKGHPPLVAVSVTEDALKGFSSDPLSIIWIFQSHCFRVPVRTLLGAKCPSTRDMAQI